MKTEAKSETSLNEPKLERVLVVLSRDLVKPGAPMQSALTTRALALAKTTGCELELFHVDEEGSGAAISIAKANLLSAGGGKLAEPEQFTR